MFGYVKPCQPQLRVCELQAYKAVYCGLCVQTGRTFGLLARFTLSYDATFLALVAMGVAGEDPEIKPGRCIFNPLRKEPICQPNDSLSFAADVSALTLYHKLKDDVADSGFGRRLMARSLLWIFRRVWRDATARRPEIAASMAEQMERQRLLEQQKTPSADEAADPTGQMLAAIFAPLDPDQSRVLERLGYLVGRYVYLADALDDLDKDRKSGSYNPFLLRPGTEDEVRMSGLASLRLTVGEAGATYQLLNVERFAPILENILTLGMRQTADGLLHGQKESSKAS